MPGPASYDGDDDGSTEVPPVPSPRMPPGSVNADPPNSPPWQVVTGRNTNSKSHRTVKKNESRRYRDHAGAWRDADDPRNTMPLRRQVARDSPRSTMTFSRQTAKGIIGSDGAVAQQENQQHQHPAVTPATSSPRGANMILSTLNRLKDAAARTPPFSPLTSPTTDAALDGITQARDEARDDAHGPSKAPRPGMNIRPKSWASVAAGTSGRRTGLEHQDEAEVPTGVFSNSFLSSEPQGASPSSWTEKTQNALLRFRDQIRGRASSPGSNPASAGSGSGGGDHEGGGKNTPSPTPKQTHNDKAMQSPGPQEGLSRESSGNPASLGSLHQSQPPQRLHSPAFLGRRSAQASPAQMASSFHPPPPPPPGSPPNEPADGQTAPYTGCPHFQTLPGAGPRVQRWESELQHPFRKGLGYIDSAELLEPFPPDGGEDDNEEGHAPHINMSRSMPSIRDGENGLEAAQGAYNHNNNSSYHHHSRHNNPATSPGRRDVGGQALHGYRQSPYRINVHPPDVAYSPSPPDGYTSLPMSRNPSSGSQQQQPAGQSRQYDHRNTGLGLRIGPVQGGGYVTGPHHHSSSPTDSPSSAIPANGGWNSHAVPSSSPHHQRHPSYPGDAPFPRPVRHRPYQTPPMSIAGGGDTHTPSDTRTEPSPRASLNFFDVQTSYQRYGERHQRQQQQQQRRAGSGSTSFAARLGRRGSPGSRSSSRGSRSRGGRSPSQSPGPPESSSRVPTPLRFGAPPGSSPDLARLQQQQQQGDVGVAGAVPMARSGSSPGLRLDDGRFVKFGEHSIDILASRERVRRLERERAREI